MALADGAEVGGELGEVDEVGGRLAGVDVSRSPRRDLGEDVPVDGGDDVEERVLGGRYVAPSDEVGMARDLGSGDRRSIVHVASFGRLAPSLPTPGTADRS